MVFYLVTDVIAPTTRPPLIIGVPPTTNNIYLHSVVCLSCSICVGRPPHSIVRHNSTMDVSDSDDDESDNELVVPLLSRCFVDGVVDEGRFLQRRRMLIRREIMEDAEDDDYFESMKDAPTKKK